jgi:hypothetical protein
MDLFLRLCGFKVWNNELNVYVLTVAQCAAFGERVVFHFNAGILSQAHREC